MKIELRHEDLEVLLTHSPVFRGRVISFLLEENYHEEEFKEFVEYIRSQYLNFNDKIPAIKYVRDIMKKGDRVARMLGRHGVKDFSLAQAKYFVDRIQNREV